MDEVAVEDIAFGVQCEEAVVHFIAESDEVVGCVAWLTNTRIINTMESVPRRSIVVTADVVHNRPHLGLRRIATRQVGRARGRYRQLMHHKFLVRLTNGVPTHVLIGSYNFTRRSNSNIGESVIVIRSMACARKFADEHRRAWRASRPIRYHG